MRCTIPAILLAAGTAAAGPDELAFTDMTEAAGVSVDAIDEGLAWGDYDSDGDEDLYCCNGAANVLFRNNGDGTFTDVTDITQTGNDLFSIGAAWGDLDNDGDLDLYVVNFLEGPDALYRNDGPIGPEGETLFTDVAAGAGTTIESSSRGVAFIDYDRDGLLDIYVNSVGDDLLYLNLGDLTFENVAPSLGMISAPGQGVGVVNTDVNDDGWPDLFTGNRSSDPNVLYLNSGGGFEDITAEANIDKIGFGMGVLSIDYDNDLDFDLYWTTWPGEDPKNPVSNALYENDGDAGFVDVAEPSGTQDASGWGISCNTGDVDNDGWADMFIANGFSIITSKSVLLRNNGDKTFSDATDAIGDFGNPDWRGCAFADYDNDGDVDLYTTGAGGVDNHLFRNDTQTDNAWITLKLVGSCSNRSAIGARVWVTTNVRTTVKEVSGGAGRGSFNSLPLEFGLGDATDVLAVTIRWPSGAVQAIDDIPIDTMTTITEPDGGDFNGDGIKNILDFVDFQTAWQAGDISADCNLDGVFNILDFVCFQGLFTNGCV